MTIALLPVIGSSEHHGCHKFLGIRAVNGVDISVFSENFCFVNLCA